MSQTLNYDGINAVIKQVEDYFRYFKPSVYCSTRVDNETILSWSKYAGQWRLCITFDEETKPANDMPILARIKICSCFDALEAARVQAVKNLVPMAEEAIENAYDFLAGVKGNNNANIENEPTSRLSATSQVSNSSMSKQRRSST